MKIDKAKRTSTKKKKKKVRTNNANCEKKSERK